MELLKYSNTPFQEISDPLLRQAWVRLLVKREDLNNPEVSGNKWWKLKYNLEEAVRLKCHTLLTYGGAFSNHIFSTAAAADTLGLKSIGIIRGEETLPLNATLSFARKRGMHLHYVSREHYRQKAEADFIDDLRETFGEFYMIPEGGTNALALKGCSEFAKEVLAEIEFDYLCLPVGTGGTLAGIINGLKRKGEIIGFSSLKGGEFLEEEVRQILQSESMTDYGNWHIDSNYHFGGYGKVTRDLNDFISERRQLNNLPLDPVYTSKMMFGVLDCVRRGVFKRGSTILMLHTGGLQNNGLWPRQ